MADVNISIGASITDLTNKLTEAKDSIKSFGEALLGVLAVREIADFVDQAAKLGTTFENVSAQLGAPIEQVQEFRLMSVAAGSSAEAFTNMMNRLEVGMIRGARATSQQAAAAHALGINMQAFTAASPENKVYMLADAMHRLGDGGTKTADVMMLAGRGVAQNIAFFNQGSESIKQFQAAIQQFQATTSEVATTTLAQLDRELVIMGGSWTALKNEIVAGVTPGINALVGVLTTLMAQITKSIKDGGDWKIVLTGINIVFTDMAIVLQLAATQLQVLWDVASTVVVLMAKAFQDLGKIIYAAFHFDLAGIAAAFDDLKEVAVTKTKEMAADIVKTMQDAAKQIQDAIAGKSIAPGGSGASGPQAPAADITGAKDRLKVIQDEFKQSETIINNLRDLYVISELQKTQLLIIEIKKRTAAEIAAGEDVKTAMAKQNLDIEKAQAELTKKLMQNWMQVADSIAGSINSQWRGILAGTTSFAQAMKNIFADMVVNLLSAITKIAVQWAVQQVFMATVGKGMAAAAAGANVSKLFADAALVFGGVFANLAPVMGPAAAGPAATSQAAVLAEIPKVAVPSFAVGIDYVPQDQFAYLHAGERVVPAEQNTQSGFGGTMALNISAVDANSFAAMLRRNPAVFDSLLNKAMQRGSLNTLLR